MNTRKTQFQRRSRHGNYTLLMVLLMTVLMSFGALSMDISLMRLGQSHAQDIADAAAHAAVVVMKQGGTRSEARIAAEEVVSSNTIVGYPPQLLDIDFGDWNIDTSTFSHSDTRSGAVQVQVGLTGSAALPLLFGPVLGWDKVEVRGNATAATKRLQAILVMDVTGSWHQKNIKNARDAAVAFLDVLHANFSPEDMVGMTVFHQRFGWEYTPFTLVSNSAANTALVRDKWNSLNVSSYAGQYQASWATGSNLISKYTPCKVYGTRGTGNSPWGEWCTSGSSCWNGPSQNNFTIAGSVGGCFPNMPRYYSDEGGTDHTTGMQMAKTMFSENIDPMAYKAMIVLTDGQPNGYSTSTTSKRTLAGYTETRFREYKYTGTHTTSQIETDTQALAQSMYNNLDVNIWFISFVESRPFMENSVKGDGWYVNTTSSSQIVPVFEKIARSLPIAIVR